MLSYNSIIGLPVICSKNNSKIAVVKDVLYCSKNKYFLGLIIQDKGILRSPRYIPIDEIAELNKTSVIISNLEAVKKVPANDSINELFTVQDKCRINNDVYSEDGIKIGKIRDIIFNFEGGIIDSYIISDGFVQDLMTGRKILPDKVTKYKNNELYT